MIDHRQLDAIGIVTAIISFVIAYLVTSLVGKIFKVEADKYDPNWPLRKKLLYQFIAGRNYRSKISINFVFAIAGISMLSTYLISFHIIEFFVDLLRRKPS